MIKIKAALPRWVDLDTDIMETITMVAPDRSHSCVYTPEEVDFLRAIVRDMVKDRTNPHLLPVDVEQIARRVFDAYNSGVCQYADLLWVALAERRRLARLRTYRIIPAAHGVTLLA